jgi:hypothetical protein
VTLIVAGVGGVFLCFLNSYCPSFKACRLLDEFGVVMLPLQIRMASDRFSLLTTAMSTSSFAYKSDKLMTLAKALRLQLSDDQCVQIQLSTADRALALVRCVCLLLFLFFVLFCCFFGFFL